MHWVSNEKKNPMEEREKVKKKTNNWISIDFVMAMVANSCQLTVLFDLLIEFRCATFSTKCNTNACVCARDAC